MSWRRGGLLLLLPLLPVSGEDRLAVEFGRDLLVDGGFEIDRDLQGGPDRWARVRVEGFHLFGTVDATVDALAGERSLELIARGTDVGVQAENLSAPAGAAFRVRGRLVLEGAVGGRAEAVLSVLRPDADGNLVEGVVRAWGRDGDYRFDTRVRGFPESVPTMWHLRLSLRQRPEPGHPPLLDTRVRFDDLEVYREADLHLDLPWPLGVAEPGTTASAGIRATGLEGGPVVLSMAVNGPEGEVLRLHRRTLDPATGRVDLQGEIVAPAGWFEIVGTVERDGMLLGERRWSGGGLPTPERPVDRFGVDVGRIGSVSRPDVHELLALLRPETVRFRLPEGPPDNYRAERNVIREQAGRAVAQLVPPAGERMRAYLAREDEPWEGMVVPWRGLVAAWQLGEDGDRTLGRTEADLAFWRERAETLFPVSPDLAVWSAGPPVDLAGRDPGHPIAVPAVPLRNLQSDAREAAVVLPAPREGAGGIEAWLRAICAWRDRGVARILCPAEALHADGGITAAGVAWAEASRWLGSGEGIGSLQLDGGIRNVVLERPATDGRSTGGLLLVAWSETPAGAPFDLGYEARERTLLGVERPVPNREGRSWITVGPEPRLYRHLDESWIRTALSFDLGEGVLAARSRPIDLPVRFRNGYDGPREGTLGLELPEGWQTGNLSQPFRAEAGAAWAGAFRIVPDRYAPTDGGGWPVIFLFQAGAGARTLRLRRTLTLRSDAIEQSVKSLGRDEMTGRILLRHEIRSRAAGPMVLEAYWRDAEGNGERIPLGRVGPGTEAPLDAYDLPVSLAGRTILVGVHEVGGEERFANMRYIVPE